MNTKKLAAIAFSLSIAPCLLLIFLAMSRLISNAITPSPAAAALPDAPVVSAISPNSAPNDIDMPVTITGTGFMAELSGTQIITPPFAFLGDILLKDLIWVDGTNLNATIPWGLNEGAYTLTVMNPDGGMGVLTDAFTVTPGIGVWTTNGPYGGTVDQITLNPDNPNTLYAQGHDVGLFVSDDAAGEWEMAYRLPRYHVDISFDAENKDVFYVGDEHGLSRTTDGAQSWEDISILPGGAWKHVPVTNPTQPGTVYASAGQWLDSEGEGGVFRSDDYGNSWITLTIGLTDTHFTSLAIHPILTQTLLAGTKSGNLFYSQDGGQTWNRTTNITATVVNVCFNPFEAFEAWATTDSGLIGMPSLHRS